MIGFVGFGRMGSALAAGAVASKAVKASQVIAYDHDKKAQTQLRKLGGRLAKNSTEVVSKSDFIFLCVKPQIMQVVLWEFQGMASLAKKCFVSIAAGIPIAKLQDGLGKDVPVFRVMPNTPALLGAGMSAISRGQAASAKQETQVKKILSSVGEVVSVPESYMDAVTAVSGSGPAYVFYLAEAITKAAANLGLPQELAEKLVRQTIYGGGLMLAEKTESAEELRRQVTSPGGTTAAAVAVFEAQNFKKIVQDAVAGAAKRSAELANS